MPAIDEKAFNQSIIDLFESVVDDLTTLHASQKVIVAKLNADAGVIDTDYANPGNLTTTKT